MVKKTKKGKDRLDKYYHLAKEQGYRSRASFKLIQLNKKYDFLSNARVLVDLCAAPGGWLQVARKYMPMSGVVVGVDLASIKSIPHVTTVEGDITTKKTLKIMKTELRGQKADVVLHDGAPNVGSNWLKDAYTQSELVLYSLKMATDLLKPNGLFVTKVFRSKDYTSLLWVLNQLFTKVEATKPKASRNASAEIYVVCHGFKAPKEVDEKLFDPTFVFEEVETTKKVLRLSHTELNKQAKKPNRQGYEDDAHLLFKRISVAEFVDTEQPIAMLADYNELTFDDDTNSWNAKYLAHEATNDEIKHYCADIKVMGRLDFRDLLKWRQTMKAYKDSIEGDKVLQGEFPVDVDDTLSVSTGGALENPDEFLSDDPQVLQTELEELKAKSDRYKKNLLKRAKVRHAKRVPSGLEMTEKQSDLLDTVADEEAFSLEMIPDKDTLESALKEAGAYDELADEEAQLASISNSQKKRMAAAALITNKLEDSDDEDEFLEDQLDQMYDKYLDKRTKNQRRMVFSERAIVKEEKERLQEAIDQEQLNQAKRALEGFTYEPNTNPLLVDFKQAKPTNKTSLQWFGQNLFDVLHEDIPNKDDASDDDDDQQSKSKKRRTGSDSSVRTGGSKRDDDDDDEDYETTDDEHDDEDDGSDDEEGINKMTKQDEATGEFETVPKEMIHDADTQATTLALAQKLLRKKERREFIDNAYHRYAFNDQDDAPQWFQDDERINTRKQLPITKEEINLIKQKMKEIDARPIKKVLEAQFRKKRKIQQRLSKMKERANQVANNNEMTALEKTKSLQKMYNNIKGNMNKRKRMYMVGTKAGAQKANETSRGPSARVKMVDSRLRADRRGEKKAKERKGEKVGGKRKRK
ncbi:spb1 [Acrasis kona]|uniref:Putative rRNA methyltransferase n=1 Tax=Acrasis kona TaxID=1008807 RepID=A0AAW2Z3C1_9EUKA